MLRAREVCLIFYQNMVGDILSLRLKEKPANHVEKLKLKIDRNHKFPEISIRGIPVITDLIFECKKLLEPIYCNEWNPLMYLLDPSRPANIPPE